MADKRITELTEETVIEDNEVIAIVDDPSGTPTTKKVQAINLLRKTATLIIASSTSVGGADYYCDGTDDDVEIQAAIDALPSTGGKIILREGTFTLGNFVNIAKDGVTIQGMGKGTIVTIGTTHITRSLFELGHATVTYNNCVIRDIYFDGNGSNRSDGQIIDNGYWRTKPIVHVLVEGCYLLNAADCAIVSEVNTYMMVRNCFIKNWLGKSDGAGIYIDANQSSVIGCVLVGSQTNKHAISGGRIVIGNHITMPDSFNTYAIYQGPAGTPDQIIDNYIYMGASAGSSARGVYGAGELTGNRIEFGISADVASVGIDQNCNLVNNNDVIKAGIGILVSSNMGVVGNYIQSARADGIKISSGSKSTVTGNIINSPGQAADNTYSGILLTGTSINNIINGNSIFGTLTNKHQYGIREASSADDKNIITSNMALNAVTTQISSQGASSVSANNITA